MTYDVFPSHLDFDSWKLHSTATADSTSEKENKSLIPVARATFLISSINLIKNCVGAGVFSLNSRVSKVAQTPAQLAAVFGLIISMALWGIYNFFIIGETCRITKTYTFSDAWSKAVSEKSNQVVQFVVTAAPIVSCVANTIVLTDVLKMFLRLFHAPSWLLQCRPAIVALLSGVVLYPLCTVKDLAALRSVSAMGLVGQLSAMAALAIRLIDGSYRPGGRYYADLQTSLANTAATAGATVSGGSISKWFVLAALLSYCFVTHYNAPRYYGELANKEKDRFHFLKMTGTSYLGAATIYSATILLSLGLFGPHSASFALNNFSPRDPIAILAFFAFGTSVLASFPLIFLNVRNFFMKQLQQMQWHSVASVEKTTALLLTFIGVIASLCNDIGKVGAVSGALFGSCMMFIFPPIMYMGALRKRAKQEEQSMPMIRIILNSILLLGGLVIGSFGSVTSIKAFFASS